MLDWMLRSSKTSVPCFSKARHAAASPPASSSLHRRETSDHMDGVPARSTGSQFGDCGIVVGFDRFQEFLNRSIVQQIFVRAAVLHAANILRAARENVTVALAKAVHLLSVKSWGIELPQMNL
ncbi:hypothetical protein [Bradyrhizobium sp. LTSPM299]|uniref:hypothetical protein n=1 Tax=Bradyrhizobium sp. LTSPM299 TaxID=1619233 RepID=UPI0012E12D38|nr:hypothetical protein [Bradyrhizobium sp. LTSPM299]